MICFIAKAVTAAFAWLVLLIVGLFVVHKPWKDTEGTDG